MRQIVIPYDDELQRKVSSTPKVFYFLDECNERVFFSEFEQKILEESKPLSLYAIDFKRVSNDKF